MKLVPCSIKEINMSYAKTSNLETLEAFADSHMECAKLEGWTQKTATQCATSLNASIKRFRMTQLKAIVRKGCVYLIRKEI